MQTSWRDCSDREDLVHHRNLQGPGSRVGDSSDRKAGFAALASAIEVFGRIDVLINNADYGHFGYVEELCEADTRAQMETNFFGAL